MSTADDLRRIEMEIDRAYLQNPLCGIASGPAVWTLLSVIEDQHIRPFIQDRERSDHEHAVWADFMLNATKHSLNWVRLACRPGYRLRQTLDEPLYQAGWNLVQLGKNYETFETVFQCWNHDLTDLVLDGHRILVNRENRLYEYEAYNRLIKGGEDQQVAPTSEELDLLYTVDQAVHVKGERFSIKLQPALVERLLAAIEAASSGSFTLPESWAFPRYTLRTFRLVYLAVRVLAAVQVRARKVAIVKGCENFGFADAVIIQSKEGLRSRIARYTGLDTEVVSSVLDDITYGFQQDNPDPAIQPLIPIGLSSFAISPFLWLHAAAERNLCVLMNRRKDYRDCYLALVANKESLMRDQLRLAANGRYRVVHGSVPGRSDLPDLDLVLIDEAAQLCLMLELKWFIDPAEIREIVEKTREITKGINQIRSLEAAFASGCRFLRDKLGVSHHFEVALVVVSKNWIGNHILQQADVPVIKQSHLEAKLRNSQSLTEVATWLAHRQYLPEIGKDFEVLTGSVKIGAWCTESYAIESLNSEPFFPL